jgi:membrane protease YdiL (CAAX protease family)
LAPITDFPAIDLPVPTLEVATLFDALINYPPLKALLPVPVLILIAPIIWLLFQNTWRELDAEARQHLLNKDGTDYRPMVALVLLAVTLGIHHYYGGRSFFQSTLDPLIRGWEAAGSTWLKFDKYYDLYSHGWWALSRIIGYVFAPLLVWKLLFPDDSILDMGLRTKGFLSHIWIYILCLVVVLGAMVLLSRQQDFLSYYPFYKGASRSWFDLLAWELAYFSQFFALEFYFRGWILAALRRTMGASAIFVMAVPYCMIHFGKPYLEAHGAIVAGVVLGSLAMRTRSIYAGFLVHITVAGLMDYFALLSRNGIPTRLWAE